MASRIHNYLLSPFTDPNAKISTHGASVRSLDGVRGFAALIVIASHTNALGMTGQGSLGVLLFFTLSGFVLALPYQNSPDRIFKNFEVAKFAANRALRILPAYVAVLYYLMWSLELPSHWLAKQITFQSGWNHLWSVVEEARFYVLFPAVVATLAVLPTRVWRLAGLSAMIFAAWYFRSEWPVDMMEAGKVQFYFWYFLAGVLACFVLPMVPRGKGVSTGFGAMSLCVVLAVLFSSDAMVEAVWRLYVPEMGSLNGWHKPEMWCALFTALLIGVTASPKSVVGTFMDSWLMRHLGLLSYALYLSHIPVLISLRSYDLEKEALFVVTLGLTYLVSILSYLFIEKPFLMLKPKPHSHVAQSA